MTPVGKINFDYSKTRNRMPGAGYSVPRPLTRIKTISHLPVNKGVILLRNKEKQVAFDFVRQKKRSLYA
jgi:hypothetical protein